MARGKRPKRFVGDESERLKQAQERTTQGMAYLLFDEVTGLFLHAADVMDVRDDVTKGVRRVRRAWIEVQFGFIGDQFDYGYIYAVYAFIAACFRLRAGDVDQLELGFTESEHYMRVDCQWESFFNEHYKGFCTWAIRPLTLCLIGQRYSDDGEDALQQALEAVRAYAGNKLEKDLDESRALDEIHQSICFEYQTA